MVLGITDPLKKFYDDLFTPDAEKAKRHKQAFAEAYHKFDPGKALETESELKLCISQAENSLKDLKTYFDLNPKSEKFEKYLFTGQKGCGKTTELNFWASQLKDKFTIVRCSADEIMNLKDVHYIDVLVLINIKLLETAIKLGPAETLVRFIQFFLSQIKLDHADQNEEEAIKNLNLVCKRMKIEAATRKTIREKMESSIFSLISSINETAQHIENHSQKRAFVFIDNLDKLGVEEAMSVFKENVTHLAEPQCHILYTMPLALFYFTEFLQFRDYFADYFNVPLVRIYDKENKENGKGIDQFVKIVDKRMKSKELFGDEVLNDLIIRTGGIIANLIELVRDCCFEMMKKPKPRIDDDTLKTVMDRKKQRLYRMLAPKERSMLRKVHDTKDYRDLKPDLFMHFLNEGLILEQRDVPDSWFDLHPVLRALLGLAEEPGYENL